MLINEVRISETISWRNFEHQNSKFASEIKISNVEIRISDVEIQISDIQIHISQAISCVRRRTYARTRYVEKMVYAS